MMHATLLVLLSPLAVAAPPAAAPTYEGHVRPILKAHCFECHGEGKKLKGGLDLRLRRLTAEGGDSGPAVVPGKSAESLLYLRVRRHEMPPGKTKLAPEDIALLARWIDGGALTARPEPQVVGP